MSDFVGAIATNKLQGRSRVSNGSALLSNVDGRSSTARRYRDVLDQLLTEIGDPTQSQQIMAREAASLTVQSEARQAALLRGEQVDEALATTSANALRRLLVELGIGQRRRRPAHTKSAPRPALSHGAIA